MKKLSELVYQSVKRYPDKQAVICDSQQAPYADLYGRIERLSQFLLAKAVGYQDRVAVFLPNSLLFIVSFFALAKIGAVALTLHINYKEEELKNYLKTFRIKYLISNEQSRARCEKAIGGSPIKLIIVDAEVHGTVLAAVRKHKHAKIYPENEVLCQFSSGSTGKLKMVGRTRVNLLREARSVCSTIGISDKDKVLCSVPLFHAYGFGSGLMPSLYSGATLILTDKFNPRQILDLLEKEKVTIFFGVPYMFSMLADATISKKVRLPALKYCFSAGISLPEEVSKKFHQKFAVFVRDLYGTTETGCLSMNLNKNIKDTLKSVGLPIQGTKIDILLENGKEAKAGEVGEVAVKTPTCGPWYYMGIKRKPVLKGGYFYPGDIGKKDKKGNLYILARKTSFINVAGTKVDPKEVEAVLKKYRGVKEAVVVGAPDPLRGEAVKAVIVSDGTPPNKNKKAILKFCRERLADFKVPRIVEFRDELPRSALGKVLKGYL